MDFNEYQKLSFRTMAELSNHREDVDHMLLGVISEAGELADAYKKNMAYGINLDMVNVEEEIGDVMWYLANLCNIEGLNLEEIATKNVQKLYARYPKLFTAEDAAVRDLNKERKVLESKTNSVTVVGKLQNIE